MPSARSSRKKNRSASEPRDRSERSRNGQAGNASSGNGHAGNGWTSNDESVGSPPPPVPSLDVVEILRRERRKARDRREGKIPKSPEKKKIVKKSLPKEIRMESDSDVEESGYYGVPRYSPESETHSTRQSASAQDKEWWGGYQKSQLINVSSGKRPLAPTRPRAWPVHDPPILDGKVPEGWTTEEPDLDENDIEGQIERCHVRIKEGIMPMIFETRLSVYQKMAAERQAAIASEPAGLEWEVVYRLSTLKAIKEHLETSGDSHEHLPNVEAIMAAYRSGKLKWTPGLVTFWSKGKQLCEPKKFDVDDFLKVNRAHDGVKGFWVEVFTGRVHNKRTFTVEMNQDHGLYLMDMHLRIPGSENSRVYNFMDDTGANCMNIYQQDVDEIHIFDPTNPGAPGLGVMQTWVPGGSIFIPTVLLEAALFDDSSDIPAIPWTAIQVAVWAGSYTPGSAHRRLTGCWWRDMISTVSIPNGRNTLYLCEEPDDFEQGLPDFNRDLEAIPPEIIYFYPARPPPFPQLAPPLSYENNWASWTRQQRVKAVGVEHATTSTQTDEVPTSDRGTQSHGRAVQSADKGIQTRGVRTSDQGAQTMVPPPPLEFQGPPDRRRPGTIRAAPPPAQVRQGRPPIPRPSGPPPPPPPAPPAPPAPAAPAAPKRGYKRKLTRDFFSNPAEFIRSRRRR